MLTAKHVNVFISARGFFGHSFFQVSGYMIDVDFTTEEGFMTRTYSIVMKDEIFLSLSLSLKSRRLDG